MRFEVGSLVMFEPDPSSGEQFAMHRRGNCVGIILKASRPILDISATYLYKIHYQNGFLRWEAEENLILLTIEEKEMNRKIEKLEEKINNQEKEIEKLKEQVEAWTDWALKRLTEQEKKKDLDK
jgi:hypothetical protein